MTKEKEYVSKLKEAFRKVYGESMDIWEEVVVDSFPEELENFLEYSAECAINLADVIEYHKKSLRDRLTVEEFEEFKEWIEHQSPQHVARLFTLIKLTNVSVLAIAQTFSRCIH